ncbi:MAG: diphthine--ammonia ligase [Candidatus Bathyarchaeia archaeon]|nr:diphthine--ammonia ligase [Candidatus Bathyarchaeota archaeon]
MKLGALFSGGKDSCLAIYKARRFHEIACLVSLIPKSEESRIFHFPNVWVTKFQAEAMELPIIQMETGDDSYKELADLSRALKLAMRKFGIEGIVTGAIRSTYQASKIQKVCGKLRLWCFNPLWLKDQEELLREVLKEGFKTIISGVFAYPLNRSFLGRIIDAELVSELVNLWIKYGINIAGEGGEIETTVLDAPFFKKRIEVADYKIQYKDNSGIFRIKSLRLIGK